MGHRAARHADLAEQGGKGANLVRLREHGFPVPEFVVLGTGEYRDFVASEGLAPVIDEALSLPPEEASRRIREAFHRPIPDAQRRRIAELVGPLLASPVAVRSSATAEDLPDASFAGQQDTFLNVNGVDDVLSAVVECWSSLWTGRAITYRRSHEVDPQAVGLAVVVQKMVPAESAGVLFTADPLSGRRSVVAIDAVAGLGERLVSGQVTPDHYEVDSDGAVTKWQIHSGKSPLSMNQVRRLAVLGRRVETAMGAPQDIEWTCVGEQIQLVQARPITNLFPVPDGPGDAIWFSFGAFQGVLEPITPLGQDMLRALFAGAASIFGGVVDPWRSAYVGTAAERLWIRLDALLRTGPGRRIVPTVLRAADPNAATVLRRLSDDASDRPAAGSTMRSLKVALRFGRRAAPNLLLALRRPEALRRRIEDESAAMLEALHRDLEAAAEQDTEARLGARIRAAEGFAGAALPTLLPLFAPVMAFSIIGIGRLRALARAAGLPDPDAVALGALRALPGNVTTRMDLDLWQVASAIREDPESTAAFAGIEVAELSRSYLDGDLPAPAQRGLAGFMADYGMRGVAEIDLGTPRWREAPDGVLQSLAAYLNTPPGDAPDLAFERSRRQAEADLATLVRAAGGLRGVQVRFFGRLVRSLFGARETPKFVLVRGLGQIREALLGSGADLCAAGILERPDDIFLLHVGEAERAFEARSLAATVQERAGARSRERRRARIPVAIAGDGRAFFEGGTDGGADLSGMGVSPGVVEGVARIVEHPGTATLKPGEILVCRGTDPAWTPLFLTAAGLVTEVGGLMTHGSVVAREYGLPAVVGVVDATVRIADGRRIRLDGSTGAIQLM